MTRTRLVVLVLVGVVLVGTVTFITRQVREPSDAAGAAARAYVDLVATAREDDLERLWALHLTDHPGALRTAGELLVRAETRITDVQLGDPVEVDRLDVPYTAEVASFRTVGVRYRLDGVAAKATIGLGQLSGTDGSRLEDWRVVSPLVGSVAWQANSVLGLPVDVYVEGVRQVRRDYLLGGSDEGVQPLYPAVYRTQLKADPWLQNSVSPVLVQAGDATTPDPAELIATRQTRRRVQQLFHEDLLGCRGRWFGCPVADVAQQAGVDVFSRRDRSLREGERPRFRFEGGAITIDRGSFWVGTPQGEREIHYAGTARLFMDNQSWRPYLTDLELDEVAR